MRRPASAIAALVLVIPPCIAGCRSAAPVAPASARIASTAAASWLTGTWWTELSPRGRRTVEHWSPPIDGMMIGINRTIAGELTVSFEHLRIEQRGDESVYSAKPIRQPGPIPFTLVESAPGLLIFENPDHDYPQRITYRLLDPQRLEAVIESISGTDRRAWIFHRTSD